MAKFEITWEAPEFEYREKSVSWYWISIIVAALIIGFSVWTKNFLFGFFIVIAEILFIAWGNQVPQILQFKVSDEGFFIGETKHYPLSDFESWSGINFGGDWSNIMFNFRSRVKQPVSALIEEAQLVEVRNDLKGIVKEVEHQITMVEIVERFLGF